MLWEILEAGMRAGFGPLGKFPSGLEVYLLRHGRMGLKTLHLRFCYTDRVTFAQKKRVNFREKYIAGGKSKEGACCPSRNLWLVGISAGSDLTFITRST